MPQLAVTLNGQQAITSLQTPVPKHILKVSTHNPSLKGKVLIREGLKKKKQILAGVKCMKYVVYYYMTALQELKTQLIAANYNGLNWGSGQATQNVSIWHVIISC